MIINIVLFVLALFFMPDNGRWSAIGSELSKAGLQSTIDNLTWQKHFGATRSASFPRKLSPLPQRERMSDSGFAFAVYTAMQTFSNRIQTRCAFLPSTFKNGNKFSMYTNGSSTSTESSAPECLSGKKTIQGSNFNHY
jgi:hypothetical protein